VGTINDLLLLSRDADRVQVPQYVVRVRNSDDDVIKIAFWTRCLKGSYDVVPREVGTLYQVQVAMTYGKWIRLNSYTVYFVFFVCCFYIYFILPVNYHKINDDA
jgi:hypothetical protein